ncbi:MAG TPA: type II secretion system F family protein [Spirochaetota bacterium]|nr:type II secretion system F family protein [Spirochaetota bacterium]
MKFKYLGRDREGNPVRGEIEVDSIYEARNILLGRGIYIIEFKEIKTKEPILRRLKIEEIIFLSRQLSLLLRSGLTIVLALDIIQENIKSKSFKNFVIKIRENILGGESFSEALSHYRKILPVLFIEVVRVGEVTGNLDSVLLRLSDFLEKEEELRRKVKNALIYPEIVAGVIIIAIIFLLISVVPIFVNLYRGAGVKLPLPTKILISISSFLTNYWYIIIPILIILYFSFMFYSKTKTGKKKIDKFLFNLPTIIGKIYRENIFLRVSHTLEILIESGITLGNSFELISRVSGNEVIRESLLRTREKIMQGQTISKALSDEGVFPLLFIRMISVGEAGGNLEDVLQEMERYFESELDNDIKKFTALLEPALTIILGIIVAFVAFSIYLPMFDMARLITGK